MDPETLKKLIKDDDSGLLDVKHPTSSLQDSDERLLSSFQEITDFFRETGHEPQANGKDMREYSLYNRLNHLRENTDKVKALLDHDEFKLLNQTRHVATIKDIFADDDLGILNDWSDSIFDIEHVPKKTATPDYIAQRTQCQGFCDFEHLFKQCHNDLAAGKRKLMPFAKEQQIHEKDFFILKGILTYIAHVGEKEICNGKKNARLRCIFENGTESDMLLRSLARELYKDGRRVTMHEDRLLDGFKGITGDDKEDGYIYILKSLSKTPEIQSTPHLYKIGFTRTSIENRIKNAEQDPTYLMAPVSVIASYQCFNLNSQRCESLLHTFFAYACLNMDVVDKDGQRHTPREWFVAPLPVINQAIEFLISGEIVNYQYDHHGQQIVRKDVCL